MKVRLIANGSKKIERFFKIWGISYLIGEDLLFDTFGQSRILMKNLKKIGVGPIDLRYIVISHEHWDHIDGLWSLLEQNPKITVYICPSFSSNFKSRLRKLTSSIIEAHRPTEIKPDIFTTGEIAGTYDGKYIGEQSIVTRTNNTLSIITGCAHPGILNIIDRVRKDFEEGINSVKGGFHLKDSSEKEILNIVNRFKELGIVNVHPVHCTGNLATKIIKRQFKSLEKQ